MPLNLVTMTALAKPNAGLGLGATILGAVRFSVRRLLRWIDFWARSYTASEGARTWVGSQRRG